MLLWCVCGSIYLPAAGKQVGTAMHGRRLVVTFAGLHSQRLVQSLPAAASSSCEDWCSKWTCGLTACGACGKEHGCGSFHEDISQWKHCATWCNENTCGESECAGCEEGDGCPRPPSPPSPPPSPTPPPLPPSPPPPPCTQEGYGLTCMDSRCCEVPAHTCFRKSGRRGSPYGYATCRISCPDDGEWDCEVLTNNPSPPLPPPTVGPASPDPLSFCSKRYERCWESHCCQSPWDGCYRKTGRQFAMCKPLPPAGTACENDENWECPGWDYPLPPSPFHPPDPPAQPPSRPPMPLLPAPQPPPPSPPYSPPHFSASFPFTSPGDGGIDTWSGMSTYTYSPTETNEDVGEPSHIGMRRGTLLIIASWVIALAVCCLALASYIYRRFSSASIAGRSESRTSFANPCTSPQPILRPIRNVLRVPRSLASTPRKTRIKYSREIAKAGDDDLEPEGNNEAVEVASVEPGPSSA